MSSQLTITTQLTNAGQWTVTATVTPGGTLPVNIFVYENTGTTTLGAYIGICNVGELTRFSTWTGAALPVFGNSFVLYSQAKIILALGQDPTSVVNNLINGATQLSLAMEQAASSTQTVTIP